MPQSKHLVEEIQILSRTVLVNDRRDESQVMAAWKFILVEVSRNESYTVKQTG